MQARFKFFKIGLLFASCLIMSSCGFRLQGSTKLAKPLHKLYLKSDEPYGGLSNMLRQRLVNSDVTLVKTPDDAQTILHVYHENKTQALESVNASQQTRKYNLGLSVKFEVTTNRGQPLTTIQSVGLTRSITVQTNLVLGGSNEANIIYKQMRYSLATSIMDRLSSFELTKQINDAYKPQKGYKK